MDEDATTEHAEHGADATPPVVEVVDLGRRASAVSDGTAEDEEYSESVERPAKVLRIGSMIKQLLDEVRQAPLDDASRARLKEIYAKSLAELTGTLSPDLAAELQRMSFPLESTHPTDAELRIAQAQLVGWLEGLFHGIQATLFAQQMSARNQLEEMRHRVLPAGSDTDGTSRTGYL